MHPFNEGRIKTIIEDQEQTILQLKFKVNALKTLNHNLNKIGLSRQYWPEDMRLIKSEGCETIQPTNRDVNRDGNIVKDRM